MALIRVDPRQREKTDNVRYCLMAPGASVDFSTPSRAVGACTIHGVESL
jgi:hypothetical protein